MFSLIKQEDEKFSHQSDWTWHWQGPSDWMFNYWQWLMRHRRQNHPPLAAAPLGQFLLRWNTSWIVGRHGQDVREKYKSGLLFKCIQKMTAALVLWMSIFMQPLQMPTQMNMCTKIHWHRHTAACPYRSFHFSSKGQLNMPELNCSATSVQQPVWKSQQCRTTYGKYLK